MSSCCSGSCSSQSPPPDNRYRKVLWIALLINFPMFGVELVSSVKSGSVALLADSADFLALYAFRNGDANMRSVWLYTRNDMIANLAVLLAAIGVFGAKAGWPDIAVASIMATLGLSGARDIIGRARSEMRGLSTSTS